jgi:hypothetical protein
MVRACSARCEPRQILPRCPLCAARQGLGGRGSSWGHPMGAGPLAFFIRSDVAVGDMHRKLALAGAFSALLLPPARVRRGPRGGRHSQLRRAGQHRGNSQVQQRPAPPVPASGREQAYRGRIARFGIDTQTRVATLLTRGAASGARVVPIGPAPAVPAHSIVAASTAALTKREFGLSSVFVGSCPLGSPGNAAVVRSFRCPHRCARPRKAAARDHAKQAASCRRRAPQCHTALAISRSMNFWILPVLVLGISAKTIRLGHL